MHLNKDQVLLLNEKHGYFQYADAQGNVSLKFANQAVEMFLRIQESAPEMFLCMQNMLSAMYALQHECNSNLGSTDMAVAEYIIRKVENVNDPIQR